MAPGTMPQQPAGKASDAATASGGLCSLALGGSSPRARRHRDGLGPAARPGQRSVGGWGRACSSSPRTAAAPGTGAPGWGLARPTAGPGALGTRTAGLSWGPSPSPARPRRGPGSCALFRAALAPPLPQAWPTAQDAAPTSHAAGPPARLGSAVGCALVQVCVYRRHVAAARTLMAGRHLDGHRGGHALTTPGRLQPGPTEMPTGSCHLRETWGGKQQTQRALPPPPRSCGPSRTDGSGCRGSTAWRWRDPCVQGPSAQAAHTAVASWYTHVQCSYCRAVSGHLFLEVGPRRGPPCTDPGPQLPKKPRQPQPTGPGRPEQNALRWGGRWSQDGASRGLCPAAGQGRRWAAPGEQVSIPKSSWKAPDSQLHSRAAQDELWGDFQQGQDDREGGSGAWRPEQGRGGLDSQGKKAPSRTTGVQSREAVGQAPGTAPAAQRGSCTPASKAHIPRRQEGAEVSLSKAVALQGSGRRGESPGGSVPQLQCCSEPGLVKSCCQLAPG